MSYEWKELMELVEKVNLEGGSHPKLRKMVEILTDHFGILFSRFSVFMFRLT